MIHIQNLWLLPTVTIHQIIFISILIFSQKHPQNVFLVKADLFGESANDFLKL